MGHPRPPSSRFLHIFNITCYTQHRLRGQGRGGWVSTLSFTQTARHQPPSRGAGHAPGRHLEEAPLSSPWKLGQMLLHLRCNIQRVTVTQDCIPHLGRLSLAPPLDLPSACRAAGCSIWNHTLVALVPCLALVMVSCIHPFTDVF